MLSDSRRDDKFNELGKSRVAFLRRGSTRSTAANAIVLAAEHPVIQANMDNFSEDVAAKIAIIRTENAKPTDHEAEIEKDGIDTGLKAINPFSGEEVAGLGRQLRDDGLRHGRGHERSRSRRAGF